MMPLQGKGCRVPLASTIGYADDVGLIDDGHDDGIQLATTRVSSISRGSKKDVDMKINIIKTKALHVRAQIQVSKTTNEEASKICKFICPHLNCGYRFYTRRGLQIHVGKCAWANEFEFEKILSSRGPTCVRQFLIRWKGYSSDYDTWEPRGSLHPELITEYEKQNGCYDYDY